MLLAGDIGGTKTALGIFSEQKGPHTPLADARCTARTIRAWR